MDRLTVDTVAQANIYSALLTFPEISEERVRVRMPGAGGLMPITVAIVLKLDEDFYLRASVNDGKVNVSVGDGNVQIQREEWPRKKWQEAVAWIKGYIAGYRQ